MRTKSYTPMFNTQDFLEKMKKNGGIDATFHNRILETEIFPNRGVEVEQEFGEVVEVTCSDYPSDKKLFTSLSFLEEGEEKAKELMPSKEEILRRLLAFPSIPYLLGGTTPFATSLGLPFTGNTFTDRNRLLYGIDCSGLLYFVTGGNVARNTSDYLKEYQVVKEMEPLDLIYFPGHVIIYLGAGRCIESREFDGVTRSFWENRRKSLPSDHQIIRIL
ncbi:C40 family peptidase [bacterium]|nr:C40 family peptidase [bacterium]